MKKITKLASVLLMAGISTSTLAIPGDDIGTSQLNFVNKTGFPIHVNLQMTTGDSTGSTPNPSDFTLIGVNLSPNIGPTKKVLVVSKFKKDYHYEPPGETVNLSYSIELTNLQTHYRTKIDNFSPAKTSREDNSVFEMDIVLEGDHIALKSHKIY